MQYQVAVSSLAEGAALFCRAAGAGGGYHPAALMDLLPAWEEETGIEGVYSLLDVVVAAEALACHWGGKLGIFSRIQSDWIPADDDDPSWTLGADASLDELCIIGWSSHHHEVSLLAHPEGKLWLTIECEPDAEVQGLGCEPEHCARLAALGQSLIYYQPQSGTAGGDGGRECWTAHASWWECCDPDCPCGGISVGNGVCPSQEERAHAMYVRVT